MASTLEPQDLGAKEEDRAQDGGETNINVTNISIDNDQVQDTDFTHLTEQEQLILKRQIDVQETKVGLTTMFRYATRNDLIILSISSLCAVIGGGILPLMSVRYLRFYTQQLFCTERYRLYLVPLPKAFRTSRCCPRSREMPSIATSSPRPCTLSTWQLENTSLSPCQLLASSTPGHM